MSLAREVEFLYQALAAEIGVIIREESNLELLKQRLYQAKKTSPEFASISILTSPTAPQQELWLINKGKPDEGQPNL